MSTELRTLTIDCRHHGERRLVELGDGTTMCVQCLRDERVRNRECACGCGGSLIKRAANVRYVNERHKQRVYREDLQFDAEAVGLPASLSRKVVDAARATANRRGDGESGRGARRATPKKPRKPSLRISYRKAVNQVAKYIAHNGDLTSEVLVKRGPWERAIGEAEELLAPLLTDAQRAAL